MRNPINPAAGIVMCRLIFFLLPFTAGFLLCAAQPYLAKSSGAFGGTAQRYYKLIFNLQEESLTNYLDYTIYHMPAEITGAYVSGYSEGQTGAVTITVNTPKLMPIGLFLAPGASKSL